VISVGPYARLFREPGVGRLIIASIVGRIPIGSATLALVLFIQGRTGSFGSAGSVAALYVLGLACMSPLLGRLLDRLGPRPVLAASALLYPSALALVVFLVLQGAGSSWIGTGAFFAGASLPPITVSMRALYPEIVTDARLLKTAYSLDSALIETMFILGPSLVALCVGSGVPIVAVAVAATCGSVGSAVFLRSDALRRWKLKLHDGPRPLLGPLVSRDFRALLASCLFYASAFGLFEMAITGFAAEHGSTAAAGVILALASMGSVVGALVFGSHDWELPPERQFLVALALMAAGMIVMVPIEGMVAFAVVSIVASSPMAAVIASQSVLVSTLAPKGMIGESFTWSATALLTGISGGFALGGAMLERFSSTAVLILAAGATLTAAAIAAATSARQAKDERAEIG
jgi:predicted MFS family arabinose efflux permease